MDRTFPKFAIQLSTLAIALIIASLLVSYFLPDLPITPAYLYIIVVIYLTTLIVFKLLLKGLRNKLSQFVNLYLLINFGKLLIFIVIIFVYSFLNRADAASFIISFFVYYFAFTVFEVISLLQIRK